MIVLLHLVQVGLCAVVFWQASGLPTLETAVYFSLATCTTIGVGNVVLGLGWRVLAGSRASRVSCCSAGQQHSCSRS